MEVKDFIAQIKGKLVVSCQAPSHSPLGNPGVLGAIAKAVELAGAAGLRLNGKDNIEAVRQISSLPIIGIQKTGGDQGIFITPRFELAEEIAAAGAHIIALQATTPRRGVSTPLPLLISKIHDQLKLGVIADISTLAEAEEAVQAGADLVATTLSGHTPKTRQRKKPDLDLVSQIAKKGIPVLAEGGFRTPQEVVQALDVGALAVVVGTAITRPDLITEYFLSVLNLGR